MLYAGCVNLKNLFNLNFNKMMMMMMIVHTSISDCHRLILLFESHSYRIRNDDSTNNNTIHCNNL